MACTFEELHDVHYYMIRKFADYCEKNTLNYSLHWGSMLGAVRHKDCIPWDDDVDIIMDIRSFKKLIKLMKKEKIADDLFFQWITTEKDYPINCARIRKDNTFMSEWRFKGLNIHNGVWIDLFVYLDKPATDFGVKLQELMLGAFSLLGQRHLKAEKLTDFDDETEKQKILVQKIINSIPFKLVEPLRKFLFLLISNSGKKNSEFVRDFEYNGDFNFKKERSLFEPTILTDFRDSKVRIPQNYDKHLKLIYGDDYMTPKQTHTHANLDYVNLNQSGV